MIRFARDWHRQSEIAKDAKDGEERQTTNRMNAPRVYALRLRKPAEQ
jgi:hypothetical protein